MSANGDRVFGRRTEPHTIIIARGESVRHFQARPWMLALGASFVFAVSIGYILSTTYLVLRDDLIAGSAARQARAEQVYEDRIASLRMQIDRMATRQVLDQHVVETKVSELLQRQELIANRDGQLAPLLRQFESTLGGAVPLPAPQPTQQASVDEPLPFHPNAPTEELLGTIDRSLGEIETSRVGQVSALTRHATKAADAIATALDRVGIKPSEASEGNSAVGGPLEQPPASEFRQTLDALDQALQRYSVMRGTATSFPLAHPLPNSSMTSGFGVRKDPIVGSLAQHSGVDFRGRTGKPIQATADGKVVKAGWSGGYGRLVEIEHRDGYITRYAHMKTINVRKGQRVQLGDIVGTVGSSGRSTGPHLHYEIHRAGKALDPAPFIRAGSPIGTLL